MAINKWLKDNRVGPGKGGRIMSGSDRSKDEGKWSQQVTHHSDALDLEEGVFSLDDPREIARSLKQSAEDSDRRKSDPVRGYRFS